MSGAGFSGHDTGSSAPQMPPLVRPPHPHQTPQPGPTPRDEQTVTQPIPFERPIETRATTTLEAETPLGPTGPVMPARRPGARSLRFTCLFLMSPESTEPSPGRASAVPPIAKQNSAM